MSWKMWKQQEREPTRRSLDESNRDGLGVLHLHFHGKMAFAMGWVPTKAACEQADSRVIGKYRDPLRRACVLTSTLSRSPGGSGHLGIHVIRNEFEANLVVATDIVGSLAAVLESRSPDPELVIQRIRRALTLTGSKGVLALWKFFAALELSGDEIRSSRDQSGAFHDAAGRPQYVAYAARGALYRRAETILQEASPASLRVLLLKALEDEKRRPGCQSPEWFEWVDSASNSLESASSDELKCATRKYMVQRLTDFDSAMNFVVELVNEESVSGL